MSEYLPTIGVYSKPSKQLDLLVKFLEDKDFEVRKNPREVIDVDYFIVDFSSGLDFGEYTEFISSVGVKCLLLVESKEEIVSKQILKLNSGVSVGKVIKSPYKQYDYSESILKELLSFGHNGTSFKLSGRLVKTIWPKKSFKKISVQTKIQTETQTTTTSQTAGHKAVKSIIEPIHIDTKVKQWFGDNKTKSIKQRLTKLPLGKVSIVLAGITSLLFIPVVFLVISFASLYASLKTSFSNRNLSKQFLSISQTSVNLVKVLNYGFDYYTNTAEVLDQSIQVCKNGYDVIEIVAVLSANITGNEIYDLKSVSSKLSAELDSLYVNLGFLKGLADNLQGFPGGLIRKTLLEKNIDTTAVTQKVYSAKEIASNLDTLLGGESSQKYLVLFQNNMELRPTGGFIGSFALITLDGGRLSEITVSDVYSADGQLKGHVDPPEPIKDVLGEGGWYLRDANWDPDFPSSASKIEWFLDKEINTKVDGVIAIDLHLVQNLLEVTGPIALPEFNKIITNENLYETTQSEVEEDFFPGSVKKASFLTSLSRQLIAELENLDQNKKTKSLLKIIQSMEEGHVQIFVHQANVQKTLNSLGYDGAVDVSTNCGARCLQDNYFVVEANLGVNKANYYVQRTHELFVEVGEDKISHELFITYNNSAKQILGNAGRYKTYTRLIVPQSASIRGVRLYQKDGSFQNVQYQVQDISGRREAGFLLEILPETSVRLQVSWDLENSTITQGGEYRLFVNKQAGTDDDSLMVSVAEGSLLLVTAFPTPSLTQPGSYIYNTNLRKDFFVKSFFGKNQ